MRSLIIVAAIVFAGSAAAQEKQGMIHATGSFDVTMSPEAQGEPPAGGAPTSRMAIAKTFSGGLTGTATGTMLAVGTPAPGHAAAYVAVDQVDGTLAGRHGGFVLLHRGTMTRAGASDLSVTIAADSGTGALAGIAGTLSIEVKDGRHLYDLAYTLPAAN